MFSFLKKIFNSNAPDKDEDVRPWDDIVNDAIAKAAMFTKPAIRLDMVPDLEMPNTVGCSLGGRPCLPADMDWPKDTQGRPMIHLAQLNYSDLPDLDPHPRTGVLSIFVGCDDVWGLDFEGITQDGHQVYYFGSREFLIARDLPDYPDNAYAPFSQHIWKNGVPLAGTLAEGSIMPASHQAMVLTDGFYPDCPDALFDYFDTAVSASKPGTFYIGGHPDFTQDDFRNTPERQVLTEVVLQVGSNFRGNAGRDFEVMWGDVGECCFLLSKDDLQNRQFGNTVYHWDCS